MCIGDKVGIPYHGSLGEKVRYRGERAGWERSSNHRDDETTNENVGGVGVTRQGVVRRVVDVDG